MEPFKNQINAGVVRDLAGRLSRVSDAFDAVGFERTALAGLEELELKARVRSLADALQAHFARPFPAACDAIIASLDAPLAGDGELASGFGVWPLCDFVERYGLDHFEASMSAMYELTQRFSAEFAIRPFIVRYGRKTMSRIMEWTDDPNEHVRRLCSEGTRPRLPWGMRLDDFVRDPSPLRPILEKLKDDESEYVRRSVANNLNDIAKDHPELVVSIAEAWWSDGPPSRRKLVKHALRTLIKQGVPGALAVLGFGPVQLSPVKLALSSPSVPVGTGIEFSVEIASASDRPQELLFDYTVFHQRKNGSLSPKVFKWTKRKLGAGATLNLTRKHSMKPVTTRKYYPGAHRLEITVNGASVASANFELTP